MAHFEVPLRPIASAVRLSKMAAPRNFCKKHNENLAYFCEQCQDRFCCDCVVVDKHNPFHRFERIDMIVQKEKEKLQEKLKETTRFLENFTLSQKAREEKALEIELKWQKLKDHIRQEFVSFHEMLIDKEKELLQQMEEAVMDSLCNLEIEAADSTSLEREEELLAQSCASSLQLGPEHFLEVSKKKLKSLEEFQKKVLETQSQASTVPDFLDLPFSLHREKVHLHLSIDIDNLVKPRVEARRPVKQYPVGTSSVPLAELFSAPSPLPPSTSLHYRLSLLGEGGRVLETAKRVTPSKSVQFGDVKPGQSFMIKVTPVYVCVTSNAGRRQSIVGRTERVTVAFTDPPVTQSSKQEDPALLSQLCSLNRNQESAFGMDGVKWHMCKQMIEETSFEEARWADYVVGGKTPKPSVFPQPSVSPRPANLLGKKAVSRVDENKRFYILMSLMERMNDGQTIQ